MGEAKRKTRQFWTDVVGKIERGELTAARAAKRYGVVEKTVKWWMYRLRHERTGGRKADAKRAPKLLPVRVRDDAAIELELGDLVVRLPSGTDASYLAAVVAALRSC